MMKTKMWLYFSVICSLAALTSGQFLYDTFEDGFMWSTATSAHQIEGAWDADGKGENIWDRYCHEGRVADNHTADVACDSYNKYPEDIVLLQNIGVAYYRFSVAWSRIVPTGRVSEGINMPGVDYYNDLINALIAANIEPVVTLYHWDLPQSLQEEDGGWENEGLVQHFTDYADVCFQSFGDRVKLWITFNEPWVVAWLGYGEGIFAPSISDDPGSAPYRVAHTILLSHAEAWHRYNDMYRESQGGQISITLDSDWKEPKTTDQEDIDAAERAMQFKLGWYANPIFGSGDYPQIMRNQVDSKSDAQGFNQSRLPTFTQTEIDRIQGTYDFFGLNHYTTQLISHFVHGDECVSYYCDADTAEEQDPSWPETGSSWLRMVPWGLRSLLNWIKDSYGDVPIIITENGCSDRNSSLQDTHRVNFLTEYINEALKANKTDGVNLLGYTAWSLMDNFEWGQGYNEKFGIHHVDFSDPARPRTVKDSATAFAQIVADNGFIDPGPGSFATSPRHSIVLTLIGLGATVAWVFGDM